MAAGPEGEVLELPGSKQLPRSTRLEGRAIQDPGVRGVIGALIVRQPPEAVAVGKGRDALYPPRPDLDA
jgi:hypothetical protein